MSICLPTSKTLYSPRCRRHPYLSQKTGSKQGGVQCRCRWNGHNKERMT